LPEGTVDKNSTLSETLKKEYLILWTWTIFK